MITHKAKYRTKDGLADYGFSFEQQADGSWRVYIETLPPYGDHDGCAPATRGEADGSRRFVSSDTAITTLVGAKDVAATWADKTQSYIRFGEHC
jgi:hypothetical protein